jgi:CRISPR/Cas system-associated exonuclease Cas4 (RecB family)
METENNANNRISKSSLITFLSCKRKYYYDLLGYPMKLTDALIYGTKFHELVNQYNESLIKGIEFSKRISEEYRETFGAFKDGFLNQLYMDGYDKKPFLTEKLYEYGHFKGIIDAVYYSEIKNKYLIIDYKTVPFLNHDRFDRDKYKLELYLYCYLFMNNKKINLENINVGISRFEQKTAKWDLNIIDMYNNEMEEALKEGENMYQLLENTDGNIADFPQVDVKKENKVCKYCNYYDICK